eukprot:14676-Heterococcus_DN1.PRE.2
MERMMLESAQAEMQRRGAADAYAPCLSCLQCAAHAVRGCSSPNAESMLQCGRRNIHRLMKHAALLCELPWSFACMTSAAS